MKYTDEEIIKQAEINKDNIAPEKLNGEEYEITVKMCSNHFYTVTYRSTIIDGRKVWDKGTISHNS